MTQLQERFFDLLDENGWDIFSIKMLKNTGHFSDYEISEALRYLVKSGSIVMLEQGKYRRRNFSDELVIGNFLAPDGGIAYWSALNYHGLTEQFPNLIFVQTAKRRGYKKLGVTYRFIKVKKGKILGYKLEGYGNHQYKITDIEKTIVDCFDLPQYSGSYPELIKAFYNAKLSAQKMVKYCKAINNIAATKRMAYLSELYKKPKMEYFLKYTNSVTNKKYNLFESDGEQTGKTNSKWKLIMNMSEEEVLEIPNQNF
jgi:predicted transcriptional regulator of viral defense system